MPDPILVERDGEIATVTLNNPAKRNALNKAMWIGLRDVFRDLSDDEQLRCIVLRGAGDEAFAAGADISEFEAERANPDQARAYDQLLREALEAIYLCPVPTVALIKGACMGGGLQIATQCDIRVAGDNARFGAPIKFLGLAMPSPEIESIMRICGPATMNEILLEGRVYKADEAHIKGLVGRVVAVDAVEAEAYGTARRIAEGAPLTARWHKAFIRQQTTPAELPVEQAEKSYFYFDTADFKEGVDAFLNKRKPEFKGK